MPCVMYVGIHMWTWWMAGLSAIAGARAAELAKTDWDREQGTGAQVAENNSERQCSRAVACLTELAVLPTVMAKLDDARAATTAKTTSGHEPKKQGVFVKAHQRWLMGRFAGSGVFLQLDQRRSS